MNSTSQRYPFIAAAALRRAAQERSRPAMVVTNDLAALLSARSTAAIVRSRALLARTRDMMGMEQRKKLVRK
jgi:hypothetical protein